MVASRDTLGKPSGKDVERCPANRRLPVGLRVACKAQRFAAGLNPAQRSEFMRPYDVAGISNAVVEPTFSSIEEWLGNNTRAYYDVLAAVGQGAWHPENDTALWIKFNLRAHHMQAQTLQRRFAEAEQQWNHVDDLLARHRLPERFGVALFDALLGLRVTRPSYVKHSGLEERTATRDLVRAVDVGLLLPEGERRGRFYVAGEPLLAIRDELRAARLPLTDPYSTLTEEIRNVR